MEKSLKKINSTAAIYCLLLMMFFIVLACNKVSNSGNLAGNLKTYETAAGTTTYILDETRDGGFIFVDYDTTDKSLFMIRTNKYGAKLWQKTIVNYNTANGLYFGTGYLYNAFGLGNTANYIFQSFSTVIKFDTTCVIKNQITLPEKLGFDNYGQVSQRGPNIFSTTTGPTASGVDDYYNLICTFDQNLNLVKKDSFIDSKIGGKTNYFYPIGVSVSGIFKIFGEKFPRKNWTYNDPLKIFSAVIPKNGKVTQTIIDTGDIFNSDNIIGQTITSDSGAILLCERNDASSNTSYPVAVKFDNNMNVVWQQQYIENNGSISPQKIFSCKDGGFLIIGAFQGSGTSLPYILKIDNNGNKQWEKTIYSSIGNGAFTCVVELAEGGYAFAGDTNFFGHELNGEQIMFLRTDLNGNYGN